MGNNPEPCCNISGTCEAPSFAEGTTNCIHCGKELIRIDGRWFTWEAALASDPRPQRQSDLNRCKHCHPTKIDPKNVIEVRYLTDDRDYDPEDQNELVIAVGGNGDLAVSVVPKGQGCIGRSVRICTSGGASMCVPGLAPAMANAFRALIAVGPGNGVTIKTQ